MPELQQHVSLRCQPDPVLRDGRTEGVPADTLEVFARARRHPHDRIEMKATDGGMTRAPDRLQRHLLREGAAAPDRVRRATPPVLAQCVPGRPHDEIHRILPTIVAGVAEFAPVSPRGVRTLCRRR